MLNNKVQELNAFQNNLQTVIEYREALKNFDSNKSLPDIDREIYKNNQEMATLAAQMWNSWLSAQRLDITQKQREDMLAYIAGMKLLGDEKLSSDSKLSRLFKHLQVQMTKYLPCWAVTSLSARGRIALDPGIFDLVVIDESHNFRNGGKITTDEDDENPKENRYLRLLNQVIRAGVRTKVLMLSATPVNNGFKDLKNQLQLAYEGEAEKIDELLNTKNSIDDIFRQAQTAYNRWAKLEPEERNTSKLLAMLSFDFFEVLDSVTIARSRKHIERYYDTADIGKFPTRLKPISRRPC